MSQQGITTVSAISKDDELGDIQFLSIKEFDNKLFHELSSSFTTTGVKITRTIPNAKTFYFANASLISDIASNIELDIGNFSVKSRFCFISIKFDNTIVDKIYYNFSFIICFI